MGIDISRLSPAAQAQIARKIAQAQAQKAAQEQEKEEKKRKYNNQPTYRESGENKIHFDSKKEARRYDELMLMLKAGAIRDLRLQQDFILSEAYTTPDGDRIRAIRYKADFVYEVPRDDDWVRVVEDVKGGNATKTRVYAIKKRLMRERYGIDITEV